MALMIEPELHLRINGRHISAKRIAVLSAVDVCGSQNRAASLCGISVPVLHRYLHEMEDIVGVPLVKAERRKTVLTTEGRELLQRYGEYMEAMRRIEMPTIACTPISSPIVRRAADGVKDFLFNIIEADDCTNLLLLQKGIPDIVVFDDPVHVYNYSMHNPQCLHFEVFQDTLMHFHAGSGYQKLRFGAQRIGFRYLEKRGIEFTIERVANSVDNLLDTGLSFFINRSLAMRFHFPLKNFTSSSEFNHSILALVVRNGMAVTLLQTAMIDLIDRKKN